MYMRYWQLINKIKIIFAVLLYVFITEISVGQEAISRVQQSKQGIIKGLYVKYDKAKAAGNDKLTAKYASSIAFIYKDNGVSIEALRFLIEALELNKRIGNNKAIEQLSGYVGLLYSDLDRYSEALPYYRESLRYKKISGTKKQIAAEQLNLAVTLGKNGSYAEAVQILDKALQTAIEVKDKILIRSCYKNLAEFTQILGFTNKSVEYLALFNSFDRHIRQNQIREIEAQNLKLEGANAATSLALQMESSKLKISQENLDLAEQKNKNAAMEIELLNNHKQITALEIQQQKQAQRVQSYIIYGFVAVFILMALLGLNIYRNFRMKVAINKRLRHQYKEILAQRDQISYKNTELAGAFGKIKEQNLSITSSINYARRIQTALIPTENAIGEYFKESFVLFKPRDIVSGDFYWLSEISNGDPTNNKVMVVSADCTGHGVPGAIMSVIGINLLHEAAREKIADPKLILSQLNKGVQEILKQDSTDNRDGMDMAVLVFDKKRNVVSFSGANNPLVYIQDDKLMLIKGDKKPIGSYARNGNSDFSQHEIQITEPTWFYMFSDGYADQFGGRSKRKFMSKNVRNLLQEICTRTPEEQKKILDLVIEAWRGDKKQIDDISIVGLKVYPNKSA